MGSTQKERITCVHEELFIRSWNKHLPTVAQTAALLPKIRQLIRDGRNNEADSLITSEAERQLQKMGATQRWPLIPHPAFDLCIKYLDNSQVLSHSYRRQLNMESGEVTIVNNGRKEEIFSDPEFTTSM